MNALTRAIEISGGPAALARSIGRSVQTVCNWTLRGNVPAAHCPSIERATKGAVRCEDLRPDVDWAVLRNSSEKVSA
ncbi:MAG: helix-turn-helix domain-containing protein [Candidatus Accumulibacter sp.]|uniref:helix-turn-helix domain-containing protein n=1 Tax=Accumulibacter sp. TaxID=2053492 RepID=UPI002584E8BA|nr:helix-turn-helix domain-containing protein [Accumulibacter sp.]MBK8117579.1 helix-turn-helix domain-containing protein [Accumulibacter sp.]